MNCCPAMFPKSPLCSSSKGDKGFYREQLLVLLTASISELEEFTERENKLLTLSFLNSKTVRLDDSSFHVAKNF